MSRPPRGHHATPYTPFGPEISTMFINLNCQCDPEQFKYNSQATDEDKRVVLVHPLVKGEHECLVETGTNTGQTTEYVGKYYTNVTTIEKFAPLHEKAVAKFRQSTHIEVLGGDTVDILPGVVSREPHYGNCVYWLDAHNTYGRKQWAPSKNPLLQEFDIIASSKDGERDAYIVMDDYRLFNVMGEYGMVSPYPLHAEIQKAVCNIWPDAQFLIGGDSIHIYRDD
ncbi:hypothetical protein ACHAWF_000919 [Thalassiosira exigua]